ncbi:MnhB domain-containing protein [Embleya sp. MST-111070]|uniref:MnhB domain-containing protein n=1 Tax=Embleya sp. MST-111070 TaxID=3398231 RepID=UPI003F73569C
MSARGRLILLLSAGGVGLVGLVMAVLRLPDFGRAAHPYGDAAVAGALRRHTANVVSSVNFDQRAFDTLGEEMILFAAASAAVVLLRRAPDERTVAPHPARVLPVVRRFGLLLLPPVLMVGVYVVAHGNTTPGGGFQGGVVLATGLHLLYLAADYRALERLRPLAVFEVGEATGAAAFAILGTVGVWTGAGFLANEVPLGRFGALASGGTVPLLNAAVGVEVGCALVVVLGRFLDQALRVRPADGGAEGR